MVHVNEDDVLPFNKFVITLDMKSARDLAEESQEERVYHRWIRTENALRKRLKLAFPNAENIDIEVI